MAEPGAGEAEQKRNVATYNAYIGKLMNAPFFNFEYSDKKPLLRRRATGTRW
jgi:hypothetical protein